MFVSRHGSEVLGDIRVGPPPAPTGGSAPAELLACVPSEECGCPEEVWLIDGIIAVLHFEADGSSEAFLDAGDWQLERRFNARNMYELRAHVFAWLAEMDDEGEG